MITRRSLIATSAGAALAAGLPLGAHAQAWPQRHVRLIVPFPPGGGTDNVGRIISARLSEIWGQQMVIENRGGGGSNVGNEAAAKSPPDGYTILFAAFPFATNQFLYSKLTYDAVADFAPITLIGTFPNILVVPNTSPAKSVSELIALAKANKGDVTFGSSGIGSLPAGSP